MVGYYNLDQISKQINTNKELYIDFLARIIFNFSLILRIAFVVICIINTHGKCEIKQNCFLTEITAYVLHIVAALSKKTS